MWHTIPHHIPKGGIQIYIFARQLQSPYTVHNDPSSMTCWLFTRHIVGNVDYIVTLTMSVWRDAYTPFLPDSRLSASANVSAVISPTLNPAVALQVSNT